MAADLPRPRLLPEKSFPAYAYLPGRQPHPVRDPAGHSYGSEPIAPAREALLGSDLFRWGIDLFNHGYYWEAHEAWEALWHAAAPGSRQRQLFKGLILLAATGVKLREGKQAAAARHAGRAAALFRAIDEISLDLFEPELGVRLAVLADHAEAVAGMLPARTSERAEPVFGFVLLPRRT